MEQGVILSYMIRFLLVLNPDNAEIDAFNLIFQVGLIVNSNIGFVKKYRYMRTDRLDNQGRGP